jgi:hypothetical protein
VTVKRADFGHDREAFRMETSRPPVASFSESNQTNKQTMQHINKVGVCFTLGGLAIYIFVFKSMIKAKQELWKLKIFFTMQKYINLQKILLKRNTKSFKIL